MAADVISTVGNFDLLSPLGQGTGAGKIYLARHRVLKTRFAVKVFWKDEAKDISFRNRDEISLMVPLMHDNICRIYEVHEDDRVLAYSMKLYRTNLLRYINNTIFGRVRTRVELSYYQKMTALADVASALAYLLENSIVHRDVCPQNILLDDDNRAVLADFGLAKKLGARLIAGSRLGSDLGNPKIYGAPEVVSPDVV